MAKAGLLPAPDVHPGLSWGAMLAEGESDLMTAPWGGRLPGPRAPARRPRVNRLGDGRRDLLDPRASGE